MDWRIIDKSLQGTLTDAEKSQLNEWLEEAASHRKLYEKIWNKKKYDPGEERFAAWRKTFESDLDQRLSKARRLKWLRWGSVAAAVFLLLVGGAEWYRWKQPTVQPSCLVAYQEPDRTKVRLMTATGEVVDLSAVAGQDTLLIDGVKVAKEQKMLAYSQTQPLPAGEKEVENRVEVPRGAEFCLSLADGSRVWLNSDSRLTYPVAFSKDSREVKLEGEAYFEVTKNRHKPFTVQSDAIRVRVLGTTFNLKSDKRCRIAEATLIEGEIEVKGNKEEGQIILTPGQRAELNKNNGRLTVKQVDAKLDAVWHDNLIPFQKADIFTITKALERFYDVKIILSPDIQTGKTYSGVLKRKSNIESVLKSLQNSIPIDYKIVGNNIFISPK